MVHLTFLVRQLTSAVARGSVHYRRRHDLCVATLASLVEEEVDERTLQAGTLADIYRESGTCDLYTQIEVDEVVFLGELPMGQGIGDTQRWVYVPVANGIIGSTLLQVALYHVVVFGGATLRHFIVWDVGDGAQQLGHLFLSLCHHLVHLL